MASAPSTNSHSSDPATGPLGRVVWITGGSTGIGKRVAEKLAAQGMKVAVSARSADKLAAMATANSGIFSYPLDVTDADAVTSTIEAIERDLGPIDLALFSAGIWQVLDVEEVTVEPILRGMEVNFAGTVRPLVPLMHRMMARKSGRLAIIASVAGWRGLPRAAAYGPTKAALISLAETLRPDLVRHNVGVTIINPGFVETPMTADNDFPMPFIVDVDTAATKIIRGLERGHYEITFPWQLVTLLKFLSVIPNRLFLRWMRKFVVQSPEERAAKAEKAKAGPAGQPHEAGEAGSARKATST
ncbi:MAG: SDR family NAD(P)-dependent oxidoreductase [Pseudomonadota bacterium]